MDINQLNRNRNAFPPEELAKYAGRSIAWNPDGTQIIADADDLDALCEMLHASSHDSRECVLERIPLADETVLGGALLD